MTYLSSTRSDLPEVPLSSDSFTGWDQDPSTQEYSSSEAQHSCKTWGVRERASPLDVSGVL